MSAIECRVADLSSTRFIIFDKNAKIITEHQTEFPQILPHAGWHEQDPMDLVDSMKECINQAVEKLEWMGWHRDSVKGIGGSRRHSRFLSAESQHTLARHHTYLLCYALRVVRPWKAFATFCTATVPPRLSGGTADDVGITNQRETTLCWSRSTGKPLCNAIVWDDARTNGLVRTFEQKLDEEGIDIDDDEEVAEDADGAPPGVELGTGGEESAFAEQGKVDEGLSTVGKAMQNLGLAGRGKEIKKKRKGNDGLVDMWVCSGITCRFLAHHHPAPVSAYPPTSPPSSCDGCSTTTRRCTMHTRRTICSTAQWTVGSST